MNKKVILKFRQRLKLLEVLNEVSRQTLRSIVIEANDDAFNKGLVVCTANEQFDKQHALGGSSFIFDSTVLDMILEELELKKENIESYRAEYDGDPIISQLLIDLQDVDNLIKDLKNAKELK